MKEKSFEQAMSELEAIVDTLEEGNLPLKDMVELYEKGAQLGKHCMEQLDAYEGKLRTLQVQEEEV